MHAERASCVAACTGAFLSDITRPSEHAASGRSWVTKRRVGVSTSPGPFSCPYSPKCVEGNFSEVRLHDPAYIAPLEPRGWLLRLATPRERGLHVLWWCIKILGREYPRRSSPLAEQLQGSSQVVDLVADLLQFGPELRLQALALGTAEPSGAAPLLLQPEALVLQLGDPVTDLSSPAHVCSPR